MEGVLSVLMDYLKQNMPQMADIGMEKKPTDGEDSGRVMSPEVMDIQRRINSDPTNITNDQGEIVGNDTWNWKKDGNPFKQAYDNAGQGSVFGLMKTLGIGGSNPTNVGSATEMTAPTSTSNDVNPTPMQRQRQAGLGSNKVQPPIEPGNIDLSTRPQHQNEDGSVSTVLTKSFNFDGKEVLLPTIADNGTPMSDQQAIQQYRQTGQHLGIYANPQSADAYGKIIHQQQESAVRYAQPSALDPNAIEELRKSLLTDAGQLDPNNPNGLSGRMNDPNSKVDQRSQMNLAENISNDFRRPNVSNTRGPVDRPQRYDTSAPRQMQMTTPVGSPRMMDKVDAMSRAPDKQGVVDAMAIPDIYNKVQTTQGLLDAILSNSEALLPLHGLKDLLVKMGISDPVKFRRAVETNQPVEEKT